jgi:hypothetical protein
MPLAIRPLTQCIEGLRQLSNRAPSPKQMATRQLLNQMEAAGLDRTFQTTVNYRFTNYDIEMISSSIPEQEL